MCAIGTTTFVKTCIESHDVEKNTSFTQQQLTQLNSQQQQKMTKWHHIFNHSIHRTRLLQRFANIELPANKTSVVFLEGGFTSNRPYCDTELLFRPESNFFFLSGVQDPDCACALNLNTKEFALFVPALDDAYALWCGDFPSNEEYKELTGADLVYVLCFFFNF